MRKLKPGDRIKGNTIMEHLVSGRGAMMYRGLDAKNGDIFIKQFKSPTPRVAWYSEFIAHQTRLHATISASAAKDFAITILDQFEAEMPHGGRAFFQISEFASKGRDLSLLLHPTSTATWHQRVVWAKVVVGSVNQFHLAKITHTDLKPDNLFLIEDPSITTGFRLKVIDLDSAIFEGEKAPWHDEGYTGTPGYFSPEHGSTAIPCAKSDVFTMGLILHELLTHGGHPYLALKDVDAEYLAATRRRDIPLPQLRDSLGKGNDREVREILHRMLHPEPEQRPSAAEVLGVLNGKPSTRPPPSHVSATAAAPRRGTLRLHGSSGRYVEFHITTALSARMLRDVGEPEFWDKDCQVSLELFEGRWYATHNPRAPNQTCINGTAVTGRQRLATKDVLTVGNVGRGIFKSPLRVEVIDD